MSKLIPTPTVDRNGRLTTVHKRADQGTAGKPSLGSVKPSLGGAPAKKQSKGKTTTKIKPSHIKWLHDDSSLDVELRYQYEQYGHEFRNEEREMPNALLYDYMRRGVDLTDAFIMDGLGVSPESADGLLSDELPGRLGTTKDSRFTGGRYPINNQQVIDAMEEAGVPPLKAFKVLENGLQDGHMDNLSIDQLVPLFNKWRYYGREGSLPNQKSSQLLDAVCSGKIPYELTEMTSRTELSRLEGELQLTNYRRGLDELKEQDYDLFIRMAAKAVKTMPDTSDLSGYDTPVTKLHKLAQEYGNEIIDLKRPDLASMVCRWSDESGTINDPSDPSTYPVIVGVEGAQYLEEVERLSIDAGEDIHVDWDYDQMRGGGGSGTKLSRNGLLQLKDAGIDAEQAYELIVVRRLRVEQAVATKRDSIPATIAHGAL